MDVALSYYLFENREDDEIMRYRLTSDALNAILRILGKTCHQTENSRHFKQNGGSFSFVLLRTISLLIFILTLCKINVSTLISYSLHYIYLYVTIPTCIRTLADYTFELTNNTLTAILRPVGRLFK